MPQTPAKRKPENVVKLTEQGIANIPQELRELPRWIGWRYETVEGSDKSSKKPVNLRSGYHVDPTNHANGVSFEDAVAVWRSEQYALSGLGFMLGDGIGGVDVDGCMDELGLLDARGQRMSDMYSSTYAEISPSGQGFKAIVGLGNDPKITLFTGKSDDGIEVYSSKRYFTVTGALLKGHEPRVYALPELLAETARELSAHAAGSHGFTPLSPGDSGGGTEFYRERERLEVSADEIVEVLHALPEEWVDDYDHWFKVGCALHHQYGGGHDGLDIWDEFSQLSPKYEADACETKWRTMGRRAGVMFTLASLVYVAKQNGYVPPRQYRRVSAEEEFTALDREWDELSIGPMLANVPPPREWVFDGLLRKGKVMVLAGSGGSSKSYMMLVAAINYGLGRSWGPMQLSEEHVGGKSLLLFAEEGGDDVHERVHMTGQSMMLTRDEIEVAGERVSIMPMRGERVQLTTQDYVSKSVEATAHLEQLKAIIVERGITFLVLDPMAMLHDVDENDNKGMAGFIRLIDRLAFETGCAIVVVHHFGKGGLLKASEVSEQNVRGASAIVAHARTVVVMHRLRDSEAAEWGVVGAEAHKWVMFSVVKNNYGKTGARTWLTVDEHSGVVRESALQLQHLSSAELLSAAREEKKFRDAGLGADGELTDAGYRAAYMILIKGLKADVPSNADVHQQWDLECTLREAQAARNWCIKKEFFQGSRQHYMTNSAGIAWTERHPEFRGKKNPRVPPKNTKVPPKIPSVPPRRIPLPSSMHFPGHDGKYAFKISRTRFRSEEKTLWYGLRQGDAWRFVLRHGDREFTVVGKQYLTVDALLDDAENESKRQGIVLSKNIVD